MKKLLILAVAFLAIHMARAQQRIVSLDGGVSEILVALGLENRIVGVDITSNYPASLKKKTQIGHNRNISAEGIIALKPTLVVGTETQINPVLPEQLKSAGIRTALFRQELSIGGIRKLVNNVAEATGTQKKAALVIQKFDKELNAVQKRKLNKKVLFIYARGTGTLMVSGKGTAIERMIQFAGATNAVTAFNDFKPLTSEALIAAAPDVLLLFDSGLQSVGGIDGLLKVPGIAETPAGRKRKIVSMDGELLSGFTLRLPQAVKILQSKLAQ